MLHERQEIVDPLLATLPQHQSRYSLPLTRTPQHMWKEVARRHASGEKAYASWRGAAASRTKL
jgi:hypothetical protein